MNLFKVSFRLGLSALASVVGLAAFAHEPRPGPNGGWKVDAGAWHAELVANATPNVIVFLFDGADQPVSAGPHWPFSSAIWPCSSGAARWPHLSCRWQRLADQHTEMRAP